MQNDTDNGGEHKPENDPNVTQHDPEMIQNDPEIIQSDQKSSNIIQHDPKRPKPSNTFDVYFCGKTQHDPTRSKLIQSDSNHQKHFDVYFCGRPKMNQNEPK